MKVRQQQVPQPGVLTIRIILTEGAVHCLRKVALMYLVRLLMLNVKPQRRTVKWVRRQRADT